MSRLFTSEIPLDFGPDRLHRFLRMETHRVVPRVKRQLREAVRGEVPDRPGVYGMVTDKGELIYIGKAKQLRTRLLCYFRPRSRDPKAGRIIANAAGILWQAMPSEFAALHRELELIRRWRPRFNVQGQPHVRRPTWLCLGRRPAPYAFLTQKRTGDVVGIYGPLPNTRKTHEAVRRVNDWFGLRDCPQSTPMRFSDQRELFPVVRAAGCLRYEIGTCSGPCAAACSKRQYQRQVRSAKAFLDGEDRGLLAELRDALAEASSGLQFERAAVLRDQLAALTWLDGRLYRLRRLRDHGSFIYPLTGFDGRTIWYVIHGGEAVAAVPAPHDGPSRKRTEETLVTIFKTSCGLESGNFNSLQRESVLLIESWFRRYPAERQWVMSPEQAITSTRERVSGSGPPQKVPEKGGRAWVRRIA